MLAIIICAKEVVALWKIQKGYDSVTRTFRLPEDLISKLEALASVNKISLNQLVIQCLRYSVENLDTEDEKNNP